MTAFFFSTVSSLTLSTVPLQGGHGLMDLVLVLAVRNGLAGSAAHLEPSLPDAISSLRPARVTTAPLAATGTRASARSEWCRGPSAQGNRGTVPCCGLVSRFGRCCLAQSPQLGEGMQDPGIRLTLGGGMCGSSSWGQLASSARPLRLGCRRRDTRSSPSHAAEQHLGLRPASMVNLDVAQATDPTLAPHLAGVDAVVNLLGPCRTVPAIRRRASMSRVRSPCSKPAR